MKKTIALLLALTMLACLYGCEGPGGESTHPAETVRPTKPASDEYAFNYKGTDIVMNAPAGDIIAALGEPRSYSEETSCAFVGLDKTYFFGSFYLQTYPLEGEDYIYCLWIVDDSVETPEGIYIGASQAAVEAVYGAEAFNGSNAYVITGENSRLTIILDNGVVYSIQYDAVL